MAYCFYNFVFISGILNFVHTSSEDTVSCFYKTRVTASECRIICDPPCPFQVGKMQINEMKIFLLLNCNKFCAKGLRKIKIKCGKCEFELCDLCASVSNPSDQLTTSRQKWFSMDKDYRGMLEEVTNAINSGTPKTFNLLRISLPIFINLTDDATACNTTRVLSRITMIPWEKMSQPPELKRYGNFILSALENYTHSISIEREGQMLTTDQLALGFIKSKYNKKVILKVPKGGTIRDAEISVKKVDPRDRLLISASVRTPKPCRVEFSLFSSANVFKSMFKEKHGFRDITEVLSPVTSVKSTGCKSMSISFSPHSHLTNATCAIWNFKNSSWDKYWCKTSPIKDNQVRCTCKCTLVGHTYFAIVNQKAKQVQTHVRNLEKLTLNSEHNTKEETEKMLIDIRDLQNSIQNNSDLLSLFLPNVTKILSNALATKLSIMAKVDSFGETVLSSIQSYSNLLPMTDDGIWSAAERLAFGSISCRNANIVTFLGSMNETANTARIVKILPEMQVSVSISINTSDVQSDRVDFSLFSDSNLFTAMVKTKDASRHARSQVISPVIAARAKLRNRTNDKKNSVYIQFFHNVSETDKLQCVFWNTKISSWDSAGCHVRNMSTNNIQCECSHLTNFALLFTRYTQRRVYLEVLTYVCLGFSCITLVITIIANSMYLHHLLRFGRSPGNHLKPSIRASSILLSLCTSLLGGHLMFLVGGNHQSQDIGCKVIGVLVHFFYLCVFSWSMIEGLNIFFSFVYIIFSKNRLSIDIAHFFKKASFFGWGIPAIIVFLTLVINGSKNYGLTTESIDYQEQGLCFLKQTPFFVTFIGPYLLCLVCNLIVLVMLAVALRRHDSSSLSSNKVTWKRRALGFCGICVVLNLTWIIGAVKIIVDNEVLMILFIIINGLQGFFIFVFYCLLKTEVRRHVLDMIFVNKLMQSSEQNWSSTKNILTASTSQTNLELKRMEKKHEGFYRGQFQGQIPTVNDALTDDPT